MLNGESIPRISYLPVDGVEKIEALMDKMAELLQQGKIFQFTLVPLDYGNRSTLKIPGDFNSTHVCITARDGY
jgi:hypothetical protein